MKATREEQRAEAIRRLEKWETDEFLKMAFENNELAVCEVFGNRYSNEFVVLSSELDKEILQQVRDAEATYGIMAYVTIKTIAEFGIVYDILYVSENKEDWAIDAELMEDNVSMSYCINTTEPLFTEFGTIGIAATKGGLYRIC